jgi:hypothetical protein
LDITENNSNDKTKEWRLLLSLKDLGLSLNNGVTMLCRVKQVKFKVITESAGYSRNALYHSLREHRVPRKRLYDSVLKHLNVDPWAVYGITQALEIEDNTESSLGNGNFEKPGCVRDESKHEHY